MNANGLFTAHGVGGAGTSTAAPFNDQQKSTFLGAGPRPGVVGETPLGGNWSFDWLAGAAVLFGQRTLTSSTTLYEVPSAIIFTQNISDDASIFNLDAQAGLSYWFNPNLKITASYRFDGYFNALKTFNASGNLVDVNRFYQGPMLRLTSKF